MEDLRCVPFDAGGACRRLLCARDIDVVLPLAARCQRLEGVLELRIAVEPVLEFADELDTCAGVDGTALGF